MTSSNQRTVIHCNPCLSKNTKNKAQKKAEKILMYAMSCAVPLLSEYCFVLENAYKRIPGIIHNAKLPQSLESRQLVKEEVEYIIRIYRKEKPDIEGFKEILSHSGYHYVGGLSTIIQDAPDLAAFKDISESSVVILVWLRDKAMQIRCSCEEIVRRLPFRYNNMTKVSNAIRITTEYKKWCIAVMQRDDYKCQKCKRGVEELYYLQRELNAHHLAPLRYIIKFFGIRTLQEALKCREIFNLKNGVTCCDVCHRRYFHPNGTRSNN